MCHDYLAHTLEPMLHDERSQLESSPHSLQLEKSLPAAVKAQGSQK